MAEPSVIVIVADGLGTDVLDRAIDRGDVPALAELRQAGGRHAITTCFPSVTGVAYIPMLAGRFPGAVGIPGLRWYDRARGLPAWLGHSRSYVGFQVRRIDDDLDPDARMLWEHLPGSSLGLFGLPSRGLPRARRVDRGPAVAARAIRAHVQGSVAAWQSLEEDLTARFIDRVRQERPRFAFAAVTGGDKATHAEGADGPGARRSLGLVDELVRQLRADADRAGRRESTHVWVVSDHGHSPVARHFDLAGAMRAAGLRVRAHPWTVPDRSDCAVMVSGNAMAHVYLDLPATVREPWQAMNARWTEVVEGVLDHDAIDIVARLRGPTEIEVLRRGVGTASIHAREGRLSYEPGTGDPLALGRVASLCPEAAWECTRDGDHPDALVQLASLLSSPRSGDLVISASAGWDLRAAFEPIDHVSTHGGLHRSHMEVPLLVDRLPVRTPRRTADVFASVHRVLAIDSGSPGDGSAFA